MKNLKTIIGVGFALTLAVMMGCVEKFASTPTNAQLYH